MKTIAHREQASSTIQVDNERVRVTEYTFESGAETTFHRHEWDYVVVPQTDGELLLVDGNGNETRASLTSESPIIEKPASNIMLSMRGTNH